ncbi:MAG: pyrimidine 5'-nucleotidase [Anaerolineales bacterium]|jgi:putative hydrolase of the HAD superfamily
MSREQTIFIDLDDTLYAQDNGVWQAISSQIQNYLIQRLGLDPKTAEQVRADYLAQYGTTLNGLRVNYHIDPHDYLQFVHQIPLEKMLKPDPHLREILEATPHRKIIFTNSSRDHAQRVLTCLGVSDQFEIIIDIFSLDFVNKPDPAAYAKALTLSGDPDPRLCTMFDDRLPNLIPAGQIGFTTVLVGGDSDMDGADYQVPSIHALPEVLKRIERDKKR